MSKKQSRELKIKINDDFTLNIHPTTSMVGIDLLLKIKASGTIFFGKKKYLTYFDADLKKNLENLEIEIPSRLKKILSNRKKTEVYLLARKEIMDALDRKLKKLTEDQDKNNRQTVLIENLIFNNKKIHVEICEEPKTVWVDQLPHDGDKEKLKDFNKKLIDEILIKYSREPIIFVSNWICVADGYQCEFGYNYDILTSSPRR